MNTATGSRVLEQVADVVAARTGLHFPPARYGDLERAMREASNELGFAGDVEACGNWLARGESLTTEQVQILASHLTVGETYFFREGAAFAALEDRVLPALIAARRGRNQRLRVWSAGCCTGEEPYSIAIAIARALPDLPAWDVTILATDINPIFLRKAVRGVFGQWSFRGIPAAVRERYFRAAGDELFRVEAPLRRMVTFSYLNLAEDCYPSLLTNTNAMDVIFCRNVLIYVGNVRAAEIVRRFAQCLTERGVLIVSSVEASLVSGPKWARTPNDNAPLFHRVPAHAPLPPTPRAQHPPPSSRPARLKPVAHPPAAPPVSLAVAETLYDEGRFAEAAQAIDRLSSTERESSAALRLLGRARANLGELDAALAACDQALAIDKLAPALHFLRGTVLQELGRNATAVEAFRRVIYLDDSHVMCHFALGNLYRRVGRERDARREFDNARRLLTHAAAGDVVPESGGMSAGQLLFMLTAMDTDPGSEVTP